MILVFYCNFLNHHQVLIADELYAILGNDYRFVATLPRDDKELKGGADYSSRPYCILAGESDKAHDEALRFSREADVCVFGACSQEFAMERAKQKNCGLSFEVGERWLKRGWINILSPRLREWWWNYQKYYRTKPFYKLCSSAFAAEDDRKMLAYNGRHFKWGYFTKVDELLNAESKQSSNTTITRIMWCSRMLDWKHPELPVQLAKKLKAKAYRFTLDMHGSGEEEEKTRELAHKLDVEDVVKFYGALPNTEIINAMQDHDIFLFTSDRNEGWGAVANEAMANGCVLVASDTIGSTPYLIYDGKNGFKFKSEDVNSLSEKIEILLNNQEVMHQMQHEARKTMMEFWSPKKAASALLQLIDDLQNQRECSIKEGPCSKA